MKQTFRSHCGFLILAMVLLTAGIQQAAWSATDEPAKPQTSASPQRIVTLFPQAFGIVFILGLQERIAGLSKIATGIAANKLDKFYETFAPGLLSAADIGQSRAPNIETILKTNPDLVLSSSVDSRSSTAIKVMNENKIPVLLLSAGFGTVDQWLEAVNTMASATGTIERARAYEAFFRQRISMVAERLGDIPVEKRPKVALINTMGNQMAIRGAYSSFGYSLIALAGGRLMEKGDDPADSSGCAELMFAFDPDLIIDDAKLDTFHKSSWWGSLRAVKENRVYKTPADDKQAWVTNWFLPTYAPVGLLWLAKKIHPEKFADIDLRDEHELFCNMIYGRPFPHSGTGFD